MKSLMMTLLFLTLFARAMWTGKFYQVTTVTGRNAVNCEYVYGDQTFWKAFEGRCAASIEVR